MSLEDISRFLSYILRHKPDAIGLSMDTQGWVNIDELIQQAKANEHVLTRDAIYDVVAQSDKQRFAISDDEKLIRAVQGHSYRHVQLDYPPCQPPDVLYHGTASRFLELILAQGLVAGDRHHVHLSADQLTAVKVGQRHGQPVVITVRAKEMYQAGCVFYKSDNGVWLTHSVPVEFIDDDI